MKYSKGKTPKTQQTSLKPSAANNTEMNGNT